MTRPAFRAPLAAALSLLLAGSSFAAPVLPAQGLGPPARPVLPGQFAAVDQQVLLRGGGLLGLSFSPEGSVLYARQDRLTGQFRVLTLSESQARTVMTFLARLPAGDPEAGLALALRSYLEPRLPAAELENNLFLKKDPSGRLVSTPLGKSVLMDILTAADGQLLEPLPLATRPAWLARAGAPAAGSGAPRRDPAPRADPLSPARREEGWLASVGMADLLTRSVAAALRPPAAFDNGRHELAGFDWRNLDRELASAPAGRAQSLGGGTSSPYGSVGGLNAFTPAALNGYSVDRQAGTVRVIVAAERSAAGDRIRSAAGEERAVFLETGLDAEIFARHGARVVRAVDNLVTIDVPLPEASALGLALRSRGVESRPARLLRASAGALAELPAALLGVQFLPLPSHVFSPAEAGRDFAPKLADSRRQLGADALARSGMAGRGTLVGIIDSGVDMSHADFTDASGASRIESVMDFTNEGNDDVVGHGTHVAGTVGGNGRASDGEYRGLAPEARFRIAKVFGSKGETDESVILAAMKWMAGDGRRSRVDVINMSLGGPGEANKDPLSSMSNHLMVQGNILVVNAAGNEGAFGRGTVGSPGNSRYALTVSGVDKNGDFPFFSSQGPIFGSDGNELYSKPDVAAVAGGVDLARVPGVPVQTADLQHVAGPVGAACIYASGVIGPRSGTDTDTVCAVEGHPRYRYMSGTSMATPMVTGIAADIIGYLRANGVDYNAFQVKALIMETARDLGKAREQQGSGLVDAGSIVNAVMDRVKRGIPVGNIAYTLAMRLTSKDTEKLKLQNRYQMTALGLLDATSGRLINDETEVQAALQELRALQPPLVAAVEAPRAQPSAPASISPVGALAYASPPGGTS